MSQSLIIAEHDNTNLKPATLSLLTAALELGQSVDVLLIGYQCTSVQEALAAVPGLEKILVADHESFQYQLAEAVAPVVVNVAETYNTILAAATTTGKNLLPRVAALLDVAQISEITQVVSADTFVRPIYAGNALATVQSSDSVKVITVRSSAFAEAKREGGGSAEIVKLPDFSEQKISSFVSEKLTDSTRPELASASIVISGGRGLGSAESFQLLERLADKMGAAVGASRAAVDAGYVGNELQVGQTGTVVAPDLYIAIGISGAIQHLAGMKDSKVIVAINKDEDAPIFQVADYGLVADLFDVLPELEAML